MMSDGSKVLKPITIQTAEGRYVTILRNKDLDGKVTRLFVDASYDDVMRYKINSDRVMGMSDGPIPDGE